MGWGLWSLRVSHLMTDYRWRGLELWCNGRAVLRVTQCGGWTWYTLGSRSGAARASLLEAQEDAWNWVCGVLGKGGVV